VSDLDSVAHPLQSIPTGRLTWSEEMLFQGRTIRISTLDDFPPEAQADREFSEAEGAKSILSVPIRGMGQLVYGCIDLIAYGHPIAWSDANVTHLKIMGDVIANTLERKRAEENLAEAYDTTLEGWAKALEFRDKETEGHSRRVTETTVAVAGAMGFSEQEIHQIRRGAILHDIGKIAIPDEILKKPGPLTSEEREVVMRHPQAAYDLLVKIPHLKQALEIPYNHHEKWDGSGYPRGLQGEEIPLTARIFAVVDVWDALSSARPYRPAWERDKVVRYLRDESGKHFDPKIVNIFLELMEQGRI
jgi:HD-GYP domain-containing protein (c-di-GMP phosphodiesterase class II)